MKFFKKIKRIIKKTLAITEKELQTRLRFKLSLFTFYLSHFISILMPLIIFGKLFEFNGKFGPWTPENYFIFLFIGYNILLMSNIIYGTPEHLLLEKFWKTLPALIIAPFNRFYLLFGFIIAELIIISAPFITFFILMYAYYSISIFTLIIVIFLFLIISIIFASIGLIIGVFAVSNENIWQILRFIINLIFWASCITYPFELFPKFIQDFIKINPIYYIIDIIRLFWIEDNVFLTINLHPLHLLILFFSLIIFPIFGVYTFNIIYKKLGISGY